jgi:hypothetical protein
MIKSIINKWFTKNKTSKTENIILKNNSVLFWIGEDGLPYIKIHIMDTDTESSSIFGDMLFSINTGQYMDNILSLLVDISHKDPIIKEYIKNVISYWQNSLLAEDISSTNEDNEPHIKPTAFTFNNIVHNDRT